MASLDLPDVEVTKNSIGSGAYAVVLEVKFRGVISTHTHTWPVSYKTHIHVRGVAVGYSIDT